MKKVFLLIAMVVATMTAAQAQQQYHPVPFPTGKAYWCERYDSVGNRNGMLDYFHIRNTFFLNGEDTTIFGIIYKKLFFSYNGDTANACYYGGIYEDSMQRVFYYGLEPPHNNYPYTHMPNSNQFCMLYNFSVKEGDTLWQDEYRHNYDILIVSSIDTINIGGVLRKRIHFEYMDFTWIEGIGSSSGLLYYDGETPTCDMCPHNMLLCIIQNDSLIYHWGNSDCFPTSSIASPEATPSITAYPNPAKDRITFDFGGAQFETLRVINTAGVVVHEARLGGQTQYSLPLKGLPAGVYVYRLQNGETATQGKFVVEN